MCHEARPARFIKIRHFGFLSNRQRQRQVARARALLGQAHNPAIPAEQPAPTTRSEPAVRCPFCSSASLRLIEVAWPARQPSFCQRLDSS